MPDNPELVLVDSVEEVENFLRWLGERRSVLAVDVETTGLDPWRDKVRLCQFGDVHMGWALPYRDWRGVVRHALETYEGPMVAHNMKYDVSMLEQDGLEVPRHRLHDTMTMCHLVDSHGPKGLKQAAKRYVGAGAGQGELELKHAMKRARWTWETVPEDFEAYWLYGALDTVLTARLAEKLWRQVQPFRSAYELEVAVTWVLLDMEQRGARIDVDYCVAEYNHLMGELAQIVEWAHKQYGQEFNILSHTQVLNALLAEGFTFTKVTEKGNPSLTDEVLRGIDHPLAKAARRARRDDKFATTYFAAYLNYEVDGYVHCNVNPLGADKTGRMSISRPSMQNIPRLRSLRDAFIPREGHKLVLTDYQAQETRLIAHFAREQNMIDAFQRGEDIHTFVASMVYGVPVAEVQKEQRRRSKQCGHARNYGAGGAKLALTAGITEREGIEFARRYDQAFPRIGPFNASVQRAIRQRDEDGYGYVMSYSGRKIRVPVKKAYVGTNWLVQGSGSDALKKGLVNADRAGIAEFAVVPVHDEVVWDIPEADIADVLSEVRTAFEHTDLRVPLPIESRVVSSWGEAYTA